uniref:Uncharacterized protein n=1 Tax=Anguilla anguilla TaxID=7936 RepID=A0A0E9P7J6_ANGAN
MKEKGKSEKVIYSRRREGLRGRLK